MKNEVESVQKSVKFVDLVNSFHTYATIYYLVFSNYYLLVNIGFDTAENEPFKL